MRQFISKSIKNIFHWFGLDLVAYERDGKQILPVDFDSRIIEIVEKTKPFTLTSPERIFALCEAVKYIVSHQIPGDIVECGVWKGGSMMAAAQTLLDLQDQSRELYLFDTFEGMTQPTEKDLDHTGIPAEKFLRREGKDNPLSIWCYSSLEEVKFAMKQVGYASEKVHFIQGRVEDTIPEHAPSSIALLRLDTDWYESTKHELIHLFPRISRGGIIIVDDYGHWQGARQAVDEYLQQHRIKILLNRIDYTARIGVVI